VLPGQDTRLRDLAAIAYCCALGVAILLIVDRDQALRWDNLVHNLPLTHEAFRQWMEGRLPVWNPYLWSGSPLLADPQAQATYPLGWLGFVLAGDAPAAAMRLQFAVHVALAAAGAYVLARALCCTVLGALLAATVYALNPYFAYLATGFANEHATLAWLPWLTFTAIRSATAARPWRWIAAGAVCAALAWAAGYPQQWLYSVLIAVALGCCVGRGRLAALARAAAGPVLGLGLSLYQVLPFVTLWTSSQRASAQSLPDFLAQSISLPSWPAILLPGLADSAHNDLWFAGMNLSHLGLSAVALALVALWRPDPVRVCLLAIAGLGLWLASGASGGLIALLYDVQFVRLLRGPHKLFAWTVFGVALLAGAGASDIQRARRGGHAVALLVAAACAVAAFCTIPVVPELVSNLGGLPLVTLLVGVGGAVAVAVALLRARSDAAAPALALIATLASLLLELQVYRGPLPAATAALAEFPELRALASAPEGWRSYWGVTALAPIVSPDLRRALGVYRQLEMTTGYSAFLDPSYASAIGMEADLQPIVVGGVLGVLNPRSRVLDVLAGRNVFMMARRRAMARGSNDRFTIIGHLALHVRPSALPRVREVLRVDPVADQATALWELQTGSTEPRDIALVEEPVDDVPRALRRRCAIGPERRSASRLVVTVDCERPAFLVFAERAVPGWHVRIDGSAAPLHRVDGLVLGVRVGKGKHTIMLRYLPDELVVGALASLVVAILLTLVVVREARRERGRRAVVVS